MKGINIINESTKNLWAAIAAGDYELVKELIKAGANINFQNEEGDTLLHIAVLNRNRKMLNLLIEVGIDLNIKNNINQTAFDLL